MLVGDSLFGGDVEGDFDARRAGRKVPRARRSDNVIFLGAVIVSGRPQSRVVGGEATVP